jgi:putative DNA primase/helicase
MFTWVHEIARHSPLLAVVSPEIDSGKTTLLAVMEYMVLRPYSIIEANAANVYRQVDATLPTVLMDEADDIFERKTDLRHIFLGGWSRTNATVPRRGHRFRIFCPKAIGLKFREDGRLALPESAWSRSVIIKMKPKLATEKVEEFAYEDDETFATLRRKLARWAADNMQSLATANPEMPDGFNNRLRMNWKMLVAIAEMAGMGETARLAAIKLAARRIAEPSKGKRILAAIQKMIAGRAGISSKEIVKKLRADPDEDFGEVSQKKLSLILSAYPIHPDVVRPPGMKPFRGYRTEWFADAFARYLPAPTLSPVPPTTGTGTKRTKRSIKRTKRSIKRTKRSIKRKGRR